ncbi:hypothetical protein SAMN05421752_11339 [Natronorubrum thiooxidans]|uniref:Uncharacterized protein n=1 Tax=Natronorubrum thiooxidans TaxID=308853 RepID=A0A1N7GLJ9_9EURY|nr:hypothetical protein SAMN05421752_11339 [Natronorubrum thiooxidans]
MSVTWFDEVGEHSSRIGYGGPLETVLLRHANPDTVRDERLEEVAETLVELLQTVADRDHEIPDHR